MLLDNDITFKRGTDMSTIGYVFAGFNLNSNINDTNLAFIKTAWMDNLLLLFTTYTVGASNIGKGT